MFSNFLLKTSKLNTRIYFLQQSFSISLTLLSQCSAFPLLSCFPHSPYSEVGQFFTRLDGHSITDLVIVAFASPDPPQDPSETIPSAFDGAYVTNPPPGQDSNAVEWWWFQAVVPASSGVVADFEAIFYRGKLPHKEDQLHRAVIQNMSDPFCRIHLQPSSDRSAMALRCLRRIP